MMWMMIALGMLEVQQAAVPMQPPEAVALIDAHRFTRAVFQMTVAAGGRDAVAVYLNSSPDYRAPDDLTFRLSKSVAKKLEERLGAKPEIALVGQTITVRGTGKAVMIVNTSHGQPVGFNRYQHTVLVNHIDQLSIQ